MFSHLKLFASYESEYFRLNENVNKKGNSAEKPNIAKCVLETLILFI
jgi:hypothetical protein